jgi:hypothetical protein
MRLGVAGGDCDAADGCGCISLQMHVCAFFVGILSTLATGLQYIRA